MASLKNRLRSSLREGVKSGFSMLPLLTTALLPIAIPVLGLFVDSPVAAQITQDAVTRDAIAIPGTSLSLVPPTGFVLSEDYSGFVNYEDFSSIVLAELPPQAYSELADIFTSTPAEITAAFADRGLIVEVDAVSTVEHQGKTIPLVSAVQTLGDLKVQKYFTLFAQDSAGLQNALLLTFNVTPDSLLSQAEVVATISSAEISSPPSVEEATAELPFTFEVVPPFQRVLGLLGSAVLLNLSGETGVGNEEPLIIIASSLSTITGATASGTLPSAELAAFSERVLKETDGFADVVINQRSPIEFAGGAGHYITGSQARSDEFVAQYIRVLPDGYYIRMLVIGDLETVIEHTSAIQMIQSSVEMKP